MAVADKATYLENMNESAADKGLWNTALPIAFSRSFYDRDRCRTFSEVIVTEGPHQYVIGTRLSVDQGKVTKIDSLVSDEGDWLFNANAYLKYSKQEDWKGAADAHAGAHQRRERLSGSVLGQGGEGALGSALRATRRWCVHESQ